MLLSAIVNGSPIFHYHFYKQSISPKYKQTFAMLYDLKYT